MTQLGRPGPRDEDVLPPYQEDLITQYGIDPVAASQGHWSPYSMTATPTGRMWTRTFTAPDGTVITEVLHFGERANRGDIVCVLGS